MFHTDFFVLCKLCYILTLTFFQILWNLENIWLNLKLNVFILTPPIKYTQIYTCDIMSPLLCGNCFSNPHTLPLKALSDPPADQSAPVYHLFWCYKQQRSGLNMVVAMVSGNVSWHLVGQPSAGSLVLFEEPKGHFGRRLWPLSKFHESHRLPCKDFSSESF